MTEKNLIPEPSSFPFWKGIETPSAPLPARTDVVIIGSGISGLGIAHGLLEHGAKVHVIEQKSAVAGGMATRGMGTCTLFLLDPPFRLIAAVGLDVAREIVRFTSENFQLIHDHLDPTGVIYATKGENEAKEVTYNLEALEKLGFPATTWASDQFPDLGPGWHQPIGGTMCPTDLLHQWNKCVPVTHGCTALGVDDDGSDLVVRTSHGQSVRADMVVMTGGAQITPWTKDKFYSIRHQSIATAPMPMHIHTPMLMGYGYTAARQLNTGEFLLSGCRWATPHMEVGETNDGVIQPTVDERLSSFLQRHFPETATVDITHRWTGIMSATCDGLPIIGPLPGRPRIISCGGFGSFGLSLAPRAAKAVVEGIVTGRATGVPACFSARRFD